MLTSKVILGTLLRNNVRIKMAPTAAYSSGGYFDERLPIGKREWVGYGINGSPHYQDRPDYPAPAVRFQEITGDLVALREKEKGDWRKLTLQEKKKLYRASFRQTLAEVEAPTGEWKSILGIGLTLISISLWVYLIQRQYIFRPLPHTFSEEYQAATLRRRIDLKDGHLTGISSKWDYEKDDWKK